MGSNMAENHPVACRWPMNAKVGHGAKIILDPAVSSPFNVDLLPHADVVATSLTKYTAHEGDVIAGAVVINATRPDATELRQLVSAQLDLGRAPARDDGVSLLSPTLENRGTLAGIQTKRSIGSVLAIGGGVVAITAVILFFVSPPTDPSNSISLMPQVSVGPTVGGAAGSLLWRLP